MILIIDNYDSFTYNLVQRLGEIDANLDMQVIRNDQIQPGQIAALQPERIIISPGPCTPKEAGISNDVISLYADKMPILGVCLGHQCIGHVFGGKIIRHSRIMHGKTSMIYHNEAGIFSGLSNPFEATRYHSLIIERTSWQHPDFHLTAWTDQDEIMGVQHKEWPLYGVQFHPESFLTTVGPQLLRNFLQVPTLTTTPG